MLKTNFRFLNRTVVIATTALFVGACATNPAPTHRWASTEDADEARYAADHTKCQKAAQLSSEQRELDGSSAEFQSYKQCMKNSGYVLTAYNQE